MKKIMDVTCIAKETAEELNIKVMEAVNNYQDSGYQVDIQYQPQGVVYESFGRVSGKLMHNALITAYIEE